MRTLVLCLIALPACWTTPEVSAPDTVDVAASLPDLGQPDRHSARDAERLQDFVPPTYLGAEAEIGTATEERVEARYQIRGRSLELTLTKIQDVPTTRASFELLGRDAAAHMDGAEVRGLRFQGNPAQIHRELSGDGAGTLSIVATNTYLVELRMTPTASADELLQVAEGLDIGSMTLYAIKRFKAERQPTPPG